MSYIRDRVIILRSDPFREHDRRIVMFGQSHGLLEAVARGVSKKESKQAGHLVPMTEGEVMIAKGSVFDKLAVAKSVNTYPGLRTRLGSLTVIGSFFDLFEKLERPGVSDLELYHLLHSFLSVASQLSEEPSVERAKLLFAAATIKLLDRTGYAPQLVRCSLCNDLFEDEDVRQLPLDGSLAHEDCYRSVRSAQPNAMRVTNLVRTVARFIREEPLERTLLITGTSSGFAAVSGLVFQFLKQTPLIREPHGVYTIPSILA